MANIKDLKVKIKSTKNTLKITMAMKLVSAAKLARAQQAITATRPYASELGTTIKTISALVKDYSHEFLVEKPENKQAICLVISSDKGLCGAYNSSLAKAVKKFIAENEDLDLKFVYIGKKVKGMISKEVNSGETFTFPGLEPTIDDMRKVADTLSRQFAVGEVGKVFVAYNNFKSAMSFDSLVTQTLPMSLPEEEKEKLQADYPFDFKYDPSSEDILDTIIPEAYLTTLYTCVLDAQASEHGSRMSSQNCKEMVQKLTLKANKLRQAAITTELIEVVSGAESLNG